ncbi:MAG: crotonase/enoyl-CoA hydratase family protein [Rhodospirillales bacterium]|jgi:methylglutaconyl-CoA hydratase|nr:crotonase/enoyl-CoA hydratase family protein [Rhodospirillales bacterium]MBT4039343.1 crotonase/enoyl-CoA hydratase family protein [Rhodospirillales bacterium]MBT4626255.1 crotonase/enoyl-CoA hydratase family protein [Rhodospirillales bacterium]MBT5353076.1 crotonase/enoyl-CoA hydratase family protein [Rhodospirillales bacterium]MBT5520763.1 crotonase/enoyl-CoA hydratase family protein [Rhodospirillales bacterium]
MSAFETIRLDVDGRGVARLTLNRPDKHNSLNAQMIADLRAALMQIDGDDKVRVVVLSGEGKSFCAGGDLGWMKEQVESDRAGRIAQATELATMLKELDELTKPVIARVNGQAYGGGIGIMAVCDIVIAVQDARFALTETKLGLIPATIGPFIAARMGERAVRQVALNASSFDGHEAQGLGLVSKAVPASELDEATDKQINLFLECAPGAVTNTKAWMIELARNPGHNYQSASAERLADRWEESETEEGLACFFDRSKPSWQRD